MKREFLAMSVALGVFLTLLIGTVLFVAYAFSSAAESHDAYDAKMKTELTDCRAKLAAKE